jgi:hypothetical protein
MKRVTVRTRSITSADGTHHDETERIEETTSNELFEAWGVFMVLFLTFMACVFLIRVVLPSQPKQTHSEQSHFRLLNR